MKNLQLFSLGIAMLISFLTFGQDSSVSEQVKQKTITGTVTDASGPLPGVNVVVKYTQRGVSTDIYGNYSIKASKGEILVFSFMGMCEETRPVTDANNINIIMQEEPASLETVILPHHAIKKRTSPTISCGTTVTAEEIQLKPKQESKRYICRVERTIPGNNQALIFVDNKIISKAALKLIPSEEIKTVTVVKGAQAQALFGSDGANGAIIVTTKKGLSKKALRKLEKKAQKKSAEVK